MCHGENGDDAVARFDGVAQYVHGKVEVRPQCAVGNHHTFRESRSTTGIVDQRQLFSVVFIFVVYVFFAEIFWKFLTVKFVKMFACVCQFVCS